MKMKMREYVGSIYVLMGHLILVFPISALMICLRLLALEMSSAALTFADNLGAARSSSVCILQYLAAHPHFWPMLTGQLCGILIVAHHMIAQTRLFLFSTPCWLEHVWSVFIQLSSQH